MKSILQDYERCPYCYVCGSSDWLQSHHCIEGSGRRIKSEQHGLKVLLCGFCHSAAHNGDSQLLQRLREDAQTAFEKKHNDNGDPREYFRMEFGRSFL